MKDFNRVNKYNEGLEDLLKDSPDYEDYTENVVVQKSCGGCCSKTKGSSAGGCGSGGCCKTRK